MFQIENSIEHEIGNIGWTCKSDYIGEENFFKDDVLGTDFKSYKILSLFTTNKKLLSLQCYPSILNLLSWKLCHKIRRIETTVE